MQDAPNNMIALLGSDDYTGVVPSTSVVNGILRYIIIDVDKPGKVFYDLRDIFNATAGEKNKILPLLIRRGGENLDLNNTVVEMDGTYPSGLSFHVTGSELDANSSIIQFVMLDGMFQEVGDYVFQFTIRNTATNSKETSHPCFFSVGQNINSLAVDWNNGVKPYVSEFDKWKNEASNDVNNLRTDINNLSSSVATFDSTTKAYQETVNTSVEDTWNKKLTTANTWTGQNSFNGGLSSNAITADSVQGTNINGSNIQGTTINGTDLKLNAKSLKFTKGGDCQVEGLASSDDGTHVAYWVNANFLYITGWVDKPKTAYKTFKAYIPTSITNRLINTKPYYVAVNDYDWTNPSTATNPTEFVLYGNTGTLKVNGSGNDGGSRLDWIIPLKDA